MSEEMDLNVLDMRLSELPERSPFVFDEDKFSFYADAQLGWLKIGDNFTCDGRTFVPHVDNPVYLSSLNIAGIDELYVFAEFIGIRYASNSNRKEKTLAYAATNINGDIEIVSISNISYIVDKVVNIDKDVPECKLGLSFKFTAPVNKIYYGADDAVSSRGFRNADGSVKLLPLDRITTSYVAILANDDLKSWYDLFNDTYFKSKLPQNARITWGSAPVSYAICYLIDGDDDLSTIEGFKVNEVELVLSRTYLMQYPELFAEILLHQMIHAWGIPDAHGALFNREVARINAMNRKLAVRTEDEYIGKLEDKWEKTKKLGTSATRLDDDKCRIYCTCGGRIISTLTGKYYCESCQRVINFKAGALT